MRFFDRFFSKKEIIYTCPYCSGQLPPPTKKKKCPHCDQTVYRRTRPRKKPEWVKEADIHFIMLENAEVKNGISFIKANTHAIKQWATTGVVDSMKIYSAEDEIVCEHCKELHGTIFPSTTKQEIKIILDNVPVKGCTNPKCRCYWSPENISVK